MPIRLVVFDIAGTTVKDPGKVVATVIVAMHQFGYTQVSEEAVRPLMGYPKPLAIQMLLEKYEADPFRITPALVNQIHQDFVRQLIRFYETDPEFAAFPGVEATFQVLQEKGIRIALDTGFSKDITDTIMERLQWRTRGLVNEVVSSDEVPVGRPAPHMIRKIMKAVNIADPQEVVKVGDTEADVKEGRNAGCKYVVAITTGAFKREQLLPSGPTHIIDDISELLPILEQN